MSDGRTFTYTSADGLALAGSLHGTLRPGVLPLVCLSGLTRNARDFDALAEIVVAAPGHRPVIAFDYRGRGRSERAADASSYTVPQEAGDVLAGLAHLGVGRAIFVGTSRGALILHVLGAVALPMIAGAVLNDAGPRLEAEGLRAIRAYVGQSGVFESWTEAADHVERLNRPSFPALLRTDFERMARANFIETAEGIVADYDRRLAEGLALLDLDQPLPELWEAFEALTAVPLLVVRGACSSLLSAETVARMQTMHPQLEAVTVTGQGHAPLLETGDLPERILRFAERVQKLG